MKPDSVMPSAAEPAQPVGRTTAVVKNADLEQLKLLFDYTKFHIDLYTTIATISSGLVASAFLYSAPDQTCHLLTVPNAGTSFSIF